jgi:hypothetical protein
VPYGLPRNLDSSHQVPPGGRGRVELSDDAFGILLRSKSKGLRDARTPPVLTASSASRGTPVQLPPISKANSHTPPRATGHRRTILPRRSSSTARARSWGSIVCVSRTTSGRRVSLRQEAPVFPTANRRSPTGCRYRGDGCAGASVEVSRARRGDSRATAVDKWLSPEQSCQVRRSGGD